MRRRSRPAPVSQKEKIKTFLDERLDQGSDGAYEASQLLRGQVQRNVKQGNFKESLEIAKEGAMALFQRGFVASGCEMSMQLIEALELMKEDAIELEDSLAYIGSVDDSFETAMNTNADKDGLNLRIRVLKRAVQWSSKRQEVGTYVLGHPQLHARLGRAYFALANFELANEKDGSPHIYSSESGIKHLVLGEQPKLLASQLIERKLFANSSASVPTMRRERATASLRAVFQFLAVENLRDANIFYRELSCELDSTELANLPPLALCPVLLKTCEYNAPDMFTELRHRLQDGDIGNGSGSKPGSNNTLIRLIAQKYFNINPPPNMLTSLLSMFSSGNDDDE